MGAPKAWAGALILQMRFGRYTFRVYRAKKVKPIVMGDGAAWVHTTLRSRTPLQKRLMRLFPWLRPRMLPTDARRLGTVSLPFPKGRIDIDIYRHEKNRPAR